METKRMQDLIEFFQLSRKLNFESKLLKPLTLLLMITTFCCFEYWGCNLSSIQSFQLEFFGSSTHL